MSYKRRVYDMLKELQKDMDVILDKNIGGCRLIYRGRFIGERCSLKEMAIVMETLLDINNAD